MAKVPEYSDSELVEVIASGNAIDNPIKFLYEKYFYLLSSFILQHQGNNQDSEDLFQEVMLTFVELVRKGKFRGESSVKTFLYAINRNIWFNELKKRGRQVKRNEVYNADQPADHPGVDQFIMGREARKQVYAIIDSLGEVCRKILVAFYYENLSITEILSRLDYQNEQVVRNKKAKCMKALEQKFSSNPALAEQFKNALCYE